MYTLICNILIVSGLVPEINIHSLVPISPFNALTQRPVSRNTIAAFGFFHLSEQRSSTIVNYNQACHHYNLLEVNSPVHHPHPLHGEAFWLSKSTESTLYFLANWKDP